MNLRKNKKFLIDLFFIAGIATIAILSVWKAQYGAGGYDEAFYLTIPYRMLKGDVLFANEWHGSQLSAFLLYPIFKFYMMICKTTEGIILNFRYIYVFANAIVSIAAYSRLRKFGLSGAMAVLMYYIFVPYNIACLNYDSMGYMLIFLCAVLIGTNYKNKLVLYGISGLLFSGAVLCQPVLAATFVAFSAVLLMVAFLGERNKRKNRLKRYFSFCGGCAVAAVPVVCYLLRRVGFSRLMKSLEFVMSDPEHDTGFLLSVKCAIYSIKGERYVFLFLLLLAAAFMVELVFIKLKLNRCGDIVFAMTLLGSAAFCAFFALTNKNSQINYLPLAFVGAGFVGILKIKDKKIIRLYFTSLLFSAAHVISFLTSNQYKYVMLPALLPLSIVSIIVCGKAIFGNGEKPNVILRRVCCGCFAVAVLLNFGSLVFMRCSYVFPWGLTAEQNVKIESGCYKGIFATEDVYDRFDVYSKDFSEYSFFDNVLILSNKTWFSLEYCGTTAQYSAWLSRIGDVTVQRLEEYYSLNPDKKPQYVYICKDEAENMGYISAIEKNKEKMNIVESDYSYVIKLN